MKLPIYCISDNHFSIINSEHEISRRNKLFSLFNKIKTTGGTLVIGGDFFDFWFDYGNNHSLGYQSLFTALTDLNNKGINIHYILGNHDFWDFGYFFKTFNATIYPSEMEANLHNNEKILITHGDGLLQSDVGYRFMKKIIRSKICIFLFNLLGQKIGTKIALKISNTSAHYHHHDKHSKAIISEICSNMDKKYDGKYNYILVGHYHQVGIYDMKNTKVIFLGDWLDKFTVTTYDGINWSQDNWND